MSEQWWVVYTTATGEAYSIGQIDPAVYPAQFTAVAISDEEAAAILDCRATWSKDLLRVVPRPEEVPESVTPWQFFTWLWRNKGVTKTQVREMFVVLPIEQRVQAEIDIDTASSFRRSHPLLTQFGAALGMTEAEIDDAFRAMARLTGTQP